MGGFKYFTSQHGLWDHPQFGIFMYLLLGVLTYPLLKCIPAVDPNGLF